MLVAGVGGWARAGGAWVASEGILNGGQGQAGREYWTPARRLQRLRNQKLLLGLGRLKFKCLNRTAENLRCLPNAQAV